MIIHKVRRKAVRPAPHKAEFAYLQHLTRYVGRADFADLQELVGVSDDDYLRDLARYAIAEGREAAVVAAGGLNVHGTTLAEWQAELAAILHRCPNSAGAIDHWIFSWPEGEEPTVDQVERTLAIFMRSQGLERCKGAWGYHGDTDNPHVHLVALRIDPVTGARLTAGGGWEIDAAQRAKAVIEAEFPHWVPEAGSQYAVHRGQRIERASGKVIGEASNPSTWARRRAKKMTTGPEPKHDHKAIDADSLAYEEATGFMSRRRVAVEIAVPTLLASATLDAAHAELAAQGIQLRRHRSGAAFVIDGKTVTASIDRRTSCQAIETRFKQPLGSSSCVPAAVGRRERWPDDANRRAYYALRRPHDSRLSEAAAAVRGALGNRSKDQGFGAALKAAISNAAFPPFGAWRPGADIPDPATVVFAALGFSAVSVGLPAQAKAALPLLEGFRATQLSGRVVYRAAGQRAGRAAFIDLGDKILVHAASDRAAVRASLLLIASRFPDNRIAVTGDRAFQNLVLQIATVDGIALDGPLGRKQARTKSVTEAMTSAEEAAKRVPAPPRSPDEIGSARNKPAPSAHQKAIDHALRAAALAAAARSK